MPRGVCNTKQSFQQLSRGWLMNQSIRVWGDSSCLGWSSISGRHAREGMRLGRVTELLVSLFIPTELEPGHELQQTLVVVNEPSKVGLRAYFHLVCPHLHFAFTQWGVVICPEQVTVLHKHHFLLKVYSALHHPLYPGGWPLGTTSLSTLPFWFLCGSAKGKWFRRSEKGRRKIKVFILPTTCLSGHSLTVAVSIKDLGLW